MFVSMRYRYGIACYVFQPVKPTMLGPSAENIDLLPALKREVLRLLIT